MASPSPPSRTVYPAPRRGEMHLKTFRGYL
ncbi:hypothetical protein CKAH01_18771 [Colletotrichum kahawae]|uniref:Uncharacterized protein n=1 Tax=Colletotrichum kahawae TaxID=34407 RepID=A0AAD9Y6J7_COLKA|nr:hypothetical protein CKAH01_18771 [Colletotrichum kahawae]